MRRAQVGLFLAVGLAVLLVYSGAACRPMRLVSSTVSDGGVYMATAQWIAEGRPAGFHSANSALPLGYPAIIAALKRCGIGERGILVLHLVSLAVGLAAFVAIARKQLAIDTTPIAFAILFTLASVPCMELTVTVASEIVFFALSMGCVALLSRHTVASIVLATVVGLAAISVRTIGVALVPAIFWAVASHPSVRPLVTRRNVVVAIAALAICAVVAFSVGPRLHYTSIAGDRYNAGTDWSTVLGQQVAKLSAFGEVATNLRAEQFTSAYRPEFVLLGCIVVIAVAFGWISRIYSLKPVELYLASYAAILFVYPFFTYGAGRRFLVPVLPLIVAYAYCGARRLPLGRLANVGANLFLVAFMLVAWNQLMRVPQ